MVKMMNAGAHAKLADWGFSKISVGDDVRALDVGCGGGANVANWLKRYSKSIVTGVDYSEASVEAFKKYNAEAIKQNRCKILQANVAALPFDSGEFDCVSAFETVYF